MNEIVLNNKKNGMAALFVTILLYIASIAASIFGAVCFENGSYPIPSDRKSVV